MQNMDYNSSYIPEIEKSLCTNVVGSATYVFTNKLSNTINQLVI